MGDRRLRDGTDTVFIERGHLVTGERLLVKGDLLDLALEIGGVVRTQVAADTEYVLGRILVIVARELFCADLHTVQIEGDGAIFNRDGHLRPNVGAAVYRVRCVQIAFHTVFITMIEAQLAARMQLNADARL